MLTNNRINKRLLWFLKTYGWCLWIGIVMGEVGITPSQIEWWVFLIPLTLLIGVSKKQELHDKCNSSDVEKQSDRKQQLVNLEITSRHEEVQGNDNQ